jgi:hypothetical protein
MKPIRPNPKSSEKFYVTWRIERTRLVLPPLPQNLKLLAPPHRSSPAWPDIQRCTFAVVTNKDVFTTSFDFFDSLVLPSDTH